MATLLPDSERIIGELIKFQEEDERYGLLQFRSLVGAHQYRKLYRIFGELVGKGSPVLDWGCGNGHLSYFLLRSGHRVSSYSMEDHTLHTKLAELSLEYEYKRGDPNNPIGLPYPDNSFSAAASVGVLEHVRETGGEEVSSLQEMYRILKPGGYFFCYHFPNKFSWIEVAASLFPHKHHHQYKYDKGLIRDMCGKTGFEIIKIERYGFLPRNMWGRWPKRIRNSKLVCLGWDNLDGLLRILLNIFCQNYLFIARKPD